MPSIEQQMRRFVIDNFLFGQDGNPFANHDSFLEKGIIDSTGVLELVAFLETQFQIEIEDEEMIPANLDSVDNLVRFVEKKSPMIR